ncbi:excinuclease ABC subunit UvrA [Pseudoxanthomonas sp. PXM01]|uniref:excinuclease ABC subunit UvrA n=1 Tax=Pseudoxanthomonas sp. PXM01 TaxID=2769295 RepID=UPI001780EEB8|nr:excinuclease ABC subunit UvrA [Pseudoxanthomonas sp. PXM01]MBD9467745.1 excinuclease ABC subunit UvrA [Pseudoxanthomonas sp. PXM01]
MSRRTKKSEEDGYIVVRGAREHNLKNVDLDIPRDALVVFSGISGSGKSSLAFGTLYAEAQRRYLESVSPYARRLIDQVGVPDVDSIEGLPPAVALQQQRGTPNVRSTVGSVTTISSSLRMLYSRAGTYPAKQRMLYAEDFSPNTPQGACPHCHGLGHVYDVPESSMVPDASLSIRDRAIASWPPAWHGQNLRDILVTLGYDVDKPWRDLPKKDRDWILYTEEQPSVPVYAGFTPAETRAALRRKTEPSYMGTFIGARKYVLHTFATTQSAQMKKRVSRFLKGTVCPMCKGGRLKREALSVTFAGLDIGTLSHLPLNRIAEVLMPAASGQFSPQGRGKSRSKATSKQDARLRVSQGGAAHSGSSDVRRTPDMSEEKQIAAQRIAQDLTERIASLQALGLGYLSLDRITPTLSSGELQRLRLATQIRSHLFGVVYVLDEPSAGLHPADAAALHDALDDLKAVGNTLFVVEHDLDMLRRADWLVDVGPDAGTEGGQVIYNGPPEGLRSVERSHTRRYLFPNSQVAPRLPRKPAGWLVLSGIHRNNLRDLEVRFPLAVLTSVTGVSGSGKSSLVSQALVELVSEHLGHAPTEEGDGEPTLVESLAKTQGGIVSGAEQVKRLVNVDQKPIGRTPRSNLATYTGLFDHVRKLFAATPAAKKRRFSAGRFSFNIEQGRCATCEGEGSVHVELLFMPSVYAPCPTCHGKRYNEKTLEITWRSHDIAKVLALSVDAAIDLFEGEPVILRPLLLLRDIGLGYLTLGQPATQLSGGEAQRIKLATELQRSQRGDTLYVLDEPTTGLHPADVDKLMAQLQGLVDAGNTVVIVEHEMRVVADSDWVVDMGPGAGDQGGRIVAEGSPSKIATSKRSATAPYLLSAMQQAP